MKPRKLQEWEILTMQKAFCKAVIAAVVELGATPDTEYPWLEQYQLETRAGRLKVTPVPQVEGPGGFVALRFDDVDRAKRLLPSGLNLNPYSGKWNLHLFDVEDPHAVRTAIRNHLRKVMTIPCCATTTTGKPPLPTTTTSSS